MLEPVGACGPVASIYGLVGGLVLGVMLPTASGEAVLALPLIPAGYLLGVLLSELVAPERDRRPVRFAGLRPRRAGDLVPGWVRAVYWALLVPVLAAPLLRLIHRAPGAASVRRHRVPHRRLADRCDSRVADVCAPRPGQWRSCMMLSVVTESAVPPFEQIRVQIAQLAASGALPTGARLPSIRQLSADLGLAPGTVGRAYRELDTADVISARGRHGSFITGRPAGRTPPAEAARMSQLRAAAADYARTAAQLGATASETVQTLAQLLAES
jgi:GntR family transcriptional regulator